jgi:heat shock protein HslJ
MIRIDTGCNTGQASVTLDGTTMTIGPLALTRSGCSRDAAEVEREMTAVLQGVVSFEIDGRALDVAGVGGGLYFAAE